MAKYCDPVELKTYWMAWQLSQETPCLSAVRESGLLWTRMKDDGVLEHALACESPFKFESVHGEVSEEDLKKATELSFRAKDNDLAQRLQDDKYYYETLEEFSWEKLSTMVYSVCCGVSLKFRPPTEDVKDELVHEAFAQALSKLKRGKLKMTPGKAPPFNLLTTAIFRIMYSIKNKDKREREHKSKLVDRMVSGTSLPDFNSIKVSQSVIGNGSK